MIKNPLSSLQPEPNKLFGIYRGVVEDNRSDPQRNGRVKVRVFGVHTLKKVKDENGLEGIPTEELPWSEPALPLFEGGVSGFGMFSVPLQGAHVFVFFEAGNPMKPIYFASTPGMPASSPTDEGFNDPQKNYPTIGNENMDHMIKDVEDEKEESESVEGDIVVILNRYETSEQGTKGNISINGAYFCKCLELPWKDNNNNVSCIPADKYDVFFRWNHYKLKDVEGRTGILIHSGNYAGDSSKGYLTNSQGCLMFGEKFGTLSNQLAVLNSSHTLSKFLKKLDKKSFKFEIINETSTNMSV